MGRFSRSKEDEIVKLYNAGESQKEIAGFFGTYNTSIRRVLLRRGIIPRSNSHVQRLCKHNPFRRNDEYSDYFLGLLLTDGCISGNRGKTSRSINLSLGERDGYMVEAFRDWISPHSKVSRVLQPVNGSYMYSVNITNEEVEEWLCRKGNFVRKSYEAKIYAPINWHIMRGIFDGDGGFHKDRDRLSFFVCGRSPVFMRQIQAFLDRNGFRVYLRTRRNSSYRPLYYVEIYRMDDVLRLGELMYRNAHIYLVRKHERWHAFYDRNRVGNGANHDKSCGL